jgi:hypothetical protein
LYLTPIDPEDFVSTSLSSSLSLATDPQTAFAMVTNREYLQKVAEATGGSDIEITVTPTIEGGATIVSRRKLPADLPSYAKALVGDFLRLTETRTFGAAAADGSRRGSVSVAIDGAPITIEGPLKLEPTPDGSIVMIKAEVKASVPFVGGKLEKFAADNITDFLRVEEKVAAKYLSSN